MNDGAVAHVVTVLQCPFEHDGDDLHVVVRMHPETFSGGDDVIVQDPQHAEVDFAGIVPGGETETVTRVQPAMVSMTSLVGRM